LEDRRNVGEISFVTFWRRDGSKGPILDDDDDDDDIIFPTVLRAVRLAETMFVKTIHFSIKF